MRRSRHDLGLGRAGTHWGRLWFLCGGRPVAAAGLLFQIWPLCYGCLRNASAAH